MMSITALYAGGKDGAGGIVHYLMDSVCDDEARNKGMLGATAYYSQGGTPAGRWMGSGLAGLGNEKTVLLAGEKVEAQQLLDLIGDMKDPLTGVQLGRKPKKNDTSEDEAFNPGWDAEKKRNWAENQVARSKEKKAQPVHGFDLTFAPSKDVSVLWALSGVEIRKEIESCHQEAVKQTLKMLEDKALYTRRGAGGVEQVKTGGLVAAGFDHWDTREGDPHLHTHVVVANRVQGPDGKWRTIDSRHGLMPAVVGLSEVYDSALMDCLSEKLGVSWMEVSTTVGGKPVWGIKGLNRKLVKEFSTRRSQILSERGDDGTRKDDWKAWSETRRRKQHHQLGELLQGWRYRAGKILEGRAFFTPGKPTDPGELNLDEAASQVIGNLQKERSTWGMWNMQAEAHRVLRKFRFEPTKRQFFVDQVVAKATDLTVKIDGADYRPVIEDFKNKAANGDASFDSSTRYTTRQILDSEKFLLDENNDSRGPALDYSQANTILEDWISGGGFKLDSEQVGAALEVATSGRAVDVLVGPAGAGKTTTLSALVTAWKTNGGRVSGFAPSAAAAKVLAEATGQAGTIASWRVKPEEFQQGELVIVDEAAMASTLDLAALSSAVKKAGAKLLLVGDHHQLSAVEAGGAFSMLVRNMTHTVRDEKTGIVLTQLTPPTLEGVRRFRQPWECEASLRLREGDSKAVRDYLLNDRIKGGGDSDRVMGNILDAWWKDYVGGKTTLMLASDNRSVDTLNLGARELMVQAGIVDTTVEAKIRDGLAAGAGDTIVTRLNDRKLGVINGQVFTLSKVNSDNSIDVVDQQGYFHRLPGQYVEQNVELGYAGTVYRAQGRTVDTVHSMVSDQMTRQQLYVSMTRGRSCNTAWCVTENLDADGNPTNQVKPLDVFTTVATSSGGEKSATEIMQFTREKKQEKTYQALLGEYEAMCSTVRAKYWAGKIAPSWAATAEVRKMAELLDTPKWAARTAAMDRAVHGGVKMEDLIPSSLAVNARKKWVSRIDRLPKTREPSLVPQGCSGTDFKVLDERRSELIARISQARVDAVKAPWWIHNGGAAPISQYSPWREAMYQVVEWRLRAGWQNPNVALPSKSDTPGFNHAVEAFLTAKRLNEMTGGTQSFTPAVKQSSGVEM